VRVSDLQTYENIAINKVFSGGSPEPHKLAARDSPVAAADATQWKIVYKKLF